mgnify:CR=1 FL=1
MVEARLNGDPFEYEPKGLGQILHHMCDRDFLHGENDKSFYTARKAQAYGVEIRQANTVQLESDDYLQQRFKLRLTLPQDRRPLEERMEYPTKEVLEIHNLKIVKEDDSRINYTIKVEMFHNDHKKEGKTIVRKYLSNGKIVSTRPFNNDDLDSIERYVRSL